MTSDPEAFVARMWRRYAGVAEQRVQVLEACAQDLCDGTATPEQRASAITAAHKLTGALGTYGRPGSGAARELEQLLSEGGDPARVPVLVAVLRRAVSLSDGAAAPR